MVLVRDGVCGRHGGVAALWWWCGEQVVQVLQVRGLATQTVGLVVGWGCVRARVCRNGVCVCVCVCVVMVCMCVCVGLVA